MKKLDYRVALFVFLVGTLFSVGVYSQSAPPPLPEGNTGIAASYPNDTGISANANVLFADGYETYTTATQLTSSGNYDGYYQQQNFTIDTSTFSGGAKSLSQDASEWWRNFQRSGKKYFSNQRYDVHARLYAFPA